MSGTLQALAGVRVWVCDTAGPQVRAERDALDILGAAMGHDARVVAIPAGRLSPEFLDLSTRLAGEVLQKFVNYGARVAIVGDVSGAVAASKALADFVRESNRGRHVWFVPHLAALEARLSD